jgi:hypothetical protein
MGKNKTKILKRNMRTTLEHILEQEVLYTPHSNQKEAIACHVKKQLNERIKGNNKDLYFLTAFLDVSTQDEAIQSFRKDNPNLKNDLVEIATKKHHEDQLDRIIKAYQDLNFRRKNAYEILLYNNKKYFLKLLENQEFRRLFETIPGRFWLKGLVLLFLILKKVYKNNCEICIENILQNEQDNFLKDLKRTKGVGDKLARWAITNVDGSRFVIDTQIAKTIRKIRPDINENQLGSKYAESIWSELFGENNGGWVKFNREDFKKIFIDKYKYGRDDYQYLRFIVTQAFWFYGRDRCLHFCTFTNH